MQFLSRPFVVGDRIDVNTSGGTKMLTGYVERVDPMRTIIRSDAGLPFMLPNKACACHAPDREGMHATCTLTALAAARHALHSLDTM